MSEREYDGLRTDPEVEAVGVTVTRSIGSDGAVVVFVDTPFEPDGSDGGPGLRVMINDDPTYVGKDYIPEEVPDDGGN